MMLSTFLCRNEHIFGYLEFLGAGVHMSKQVPCFCFAVSRVPLSTLKLYNTPSALWQVLAALKYSPSE